MQGVRRQGKTHSTGARNGLTGGDLNNAASRDVKQFRSEGCNLRRGVSVVSGARGSDFRQWHRLSILPQLIDTKCVLHVTALPGEWAFPVRSVSTVHQHKKHNNPKYSVKSH